MNTKGGLIGSMSGKEYNNIIYSLIYEAYTIYELDDEMKFKVF